MFFRYFVAAILALFISFGLFYFMSFLITGEINISKNDEDIKHLNFIRVKHEKPVEIKKRTLPEEPVIQERPKKLKISNTEAKIAQNTIPFNIAKPDISLNLLKGGIESFGGVLAVKNFQEIELEIAVNVMPIFKISPKYPNRAKMLKKEGFVELEFKITKDGLVEDIVIINSKPKKIFDKSAIRAIAKWKFKPKIVSGKPVSQKARQTIEYKLR